MNTLPILLAIACILGIVSLTTIELRPSRGRHSKTLGPAHAGADDGPGPEIEYGRPLDTPAARAALVDHASALRRAAIDAVMQHDLDRGAELNQWAARLEALLKRWDIHRIDA
jgi:hypothetical protein